jgi:methyl-accepting chemotaxis protein PixJ
MNKPKPLPTPNRAAVNRALNDRAAFLAATSVPAPTKPQQTLRQRLLLTILPSILIPLFIAGLLGYGTARNRGRESELGHVQQDAFLTAQNTSAIFQEKIRVAELIGQSPTAQALFQRAASQVAESGLAPRSVDELERMFATTRQLSGSEEMNAYLRQVTTDRLLAKAFITDRYGFTIAADVLTSDFVQSDESWWQLAEKNGQSVDSPQFDKAVKQNVVALAKKIVDPTTNEFLGVIKVSVDATEFNKEIAKYIQRTLTSSQQVQLMDSSNALVVTTISRDNAQQTNVEKPVLLGGEPIAKLAAALSDRSRNTLEESAIDAAQQQLETVAGIKIISLDLTIGENKQRTVNGALVKLNDRYYSLRVIADTALVAVSSVTVAEVEAAGQDLLTVFGGTSLILGAIAALLLSVLASQLSQPLADLTETASAVTAGNLALRAKLQGTAETQTLAQGLNNLLNQLQGLLKRQQDDAEEQRQQREELESDVVQLMDDVGDAAIGDLTVRAQLSSGDVGIVADLFNSIIENLRDTAMQVKLSSGQVSTSLDVNAAAIRSLATQAIGEAESLRSTMGAVEEMSNSIQMVASNAAQASNLTHETYSTVQDSSAYMDQAVNSILNLRSTVGETAKKIKRLGESAQKIAQTVSLIDEIALKTNLLAVNASVEAARAGELGQGFTAVAEQVGALAEQSAKATKAIAVIVTAIQMETQEVVLAIETGTAQVVDSTKLVEATKQRLTQVLEKSEQINQLMQSISASTTAQNQTSSLVTGLVKQATVSSEQRSQSSEQMARAMQDTAEIARSLQESVAKFKVAANPMITAGLDPEVEVSPRPQLALNPAD